MTRSFVVNNPGGGILSSSGEFDFTNSIITGNGNATTTFGGVSIDQVPMGGTHNFRFNTVTANTGAAGVNTGIMCGSQLNQVITFSDSILFGNIVSGGGRQAGGNVNCAPDFSDFGPDPAAGANNINADPLFANAAQGDFHLTANSPCRHRANSNDLTGNASVDIDGDPRVSPTDMGADQF
jgi:hypothetical protein